MYKLACLQLSEKLFRITSYISRINLISYNLSLRINYKGASFGYAGFFNVYLKIT